MLKRFVMVGMLGLVAFAEGAQAQMQGFPSRPVTLVVPFAAGGPSDAIARLVGQSMSATLGQQVIVENVAGAGGTVGAARVAKADADGLTLLVAHVALPASASLYKSLPYDTATAFETVGLVNFGPMVLVTRKTFPAETARDLLARMKADGKSISLAHAGIGSNAFLCGLMLEQALGTRFTQVAYRGTGPAMNDLVGGQVDALCDQTTNAVPQIEAGTIKAFAITSPRRLDVVRQLPTLQEAGLDNFESVIWHGIYAPKGTPAPVVTVLNKALRTALADATIRQRFLTVGTEVFGEAEQTPEAHRTRFLRELDMWRDAIAKSGIQPSN